MKYKDPVLVFLFEVVFLVILVCVVCNIRVYVCVYYVLAS